MNSSISSKELYFPGFDLTICRSGSQTKIEDHSPVEVVPSDFMKLPGRVLPPKSWMDQAGKKPGCKACDSGKGKHSVARQTRYSKWLESHDVSASGLKFEGGCCSCAIPWCC